MSGGTSVTMGFAFPTMYDDLRSNSNSWCADNPISHHVSRQVRFSGIAPLSPSKPAVAESNVASYWMQRVVQELARQQGLVNSQPIRQELPVELSKILSMLPPPPGLQFSKDRVSDAFETTDEESDHCPSGSADGDSSIEGDLRLDQLIHGLSSQSSKTTLMIRNVPVLYTREMLLFEWENNGSYDFLYLPYSCSMQRNLSYAFVNFTSEAAALAFIQRWQKKRLPHYTARKPLNISFAEVQGRDSNLLQLKKKRVKRIKINQCQPLIFEHGVQIPLVTALRSLEERTLPFFGEVFSL